MANRTLERRLALLELEAGCRSTAIAVDIGDQVYLMTRIELVLLLDSINGADCGLPSPIVGDNARGD